MSAVKSVTDSPEPQPLLISEEEQWRLINESGVMSQVASETVVPPDRADEIFDAILLIIPFSSLLLVMDILVHRQYSQSYSFGRFLDRMLPGVPILSVFIFYTIRYKQRRRMQYLLFLLSITLGPRIIYLVNKGSWLVNIQQCPPIATIWVYTIVQLELGPSVLSLGLVWAWAWLNKMRMMW